MDSNNNNNDNNYCRRDFLCFISSLFGQKGLLLCVEFAGTTRNPDAKPDDRYKCQPAAVER